MNEQRMLEDKQRLEEQIKSIDLELKQLPNKRIFCSKNGTCFKWYESDGKNNKYIPKKKRAYAERLAMKKYLELYREDLLQEIAAINFYLRHHNSVGGKAQQLITNNPAYEELLASYFKPTSQELLEWMNSPYAHNELHSENLIYKTNAGIYVRSKSETFIVMLLHMKKIPFRYECLLKLGETPYYPDFTIRHPETGKIYYWEHFGKMDSPDYMKSVFPKMQAYANHGIIPNINLITTFETKDNPIELEMIEKIIDYYFD